MAPWISGNLGDDMEMPETAGRQTEALEREAQESKTPIRQGSQTEQENETQLASIRDLMMRARARNVWLTLSEIAAATEFGEASISAQLRHLRKAHHGGYRVEKRRRRPARNAAAREPFRDLRRAEVIWEYRVLPPA